MTTPPREEFFSQVKRAPPDWSLAVVFALPERIPPGKGDDVISKLEDVAKDVPHAVSVVRLGFSSYVVVTKLPMPELIHQLRNADTVRGQVLFGAPSVGADGMRSLSLLELGAHEEAVGHPEGRLFALAGDRVEMIP